MLNHCDICNKWMTPKTDQGTVCADHVRNLYTNRRQGERRTWQVPGIVGAFDRRAEGEAAERRLAERRAADQGSINDRRASWHNGMSTDPTGLPMVSSR